MDAHLDRCGLQFHHLGLAVKKPQGAFLYLAALGYREGAAVYDALQCVNLAMYHHTVMPDVEVIWPGDGPSPIDNMLKRWDGRIYHQCYVTKNRTASISALRGAGLEVIEVAAPKPAALFDGLEVSFYSVGGVGLIELIDGIPAQRNG